MVTDFDIGECVWIFDIEDGEYREGYIEEVAIKKKYNHLGNCWKIKFYYTIHTFDQQEVTIEDCYIGRTIEQCKKRFLKRLRIYNDD